MQLPENLTELASTQIDLVCTEATSLVQMGGIDEATRLALTYLEECTAATYMSIKIRYILRKS
jgi:hypothetical protein